jgi:N-acetyl-gamma-glutamyl-phosphate reductase
MIRVGVVGSTGLVGESLIRAVLGHPGAEVAVVTSAHACGQVISDVLPSLRGEIDLIAQEPDPANLIGQVDVAFLAGKGPESMTMAPPLLKAGVKVIDIGGEFRLSSAADYQKWYGNKHICSELLKEAVYGLPELFEAEIRSARLVANPGCYPTGALLAVAPFLKAGLISADGLIFDSYSGASGAGRTYSAGGRNLYVDVNENLRAYALGNHKHTPEIELGVDFIAGGEHKVTFVPHLAPLDRGIFTTAFCRPSGEIGLEDLFKAGQEFCAGQPFLRFLEKADQVWTRNVQSSNYCDLSATFVEDTKVVVAVSAIDNTVKGAAGQAVENMNLMFDLERRTGLTGRSL